MARPNPLQVLGDDEQARALLERRAAELARHAEEAVAPVLEPFVHFHLGQGHEYGVPCRWVDEVVAVPAIARVPGAPAPLLGVINRRGRMLPVVDLRLHFGLASDAGVAPALHDVVVVSAGDHAIGLRVSGLIGMSEYPPDALVPGPVEPGAAGGSQFLGLLPQQHLAMLDAEKILGDLCA